MEGTLKKWTNYWNGWKPRWFVLDKGILSYYQTKETVLEGCKGAVSVSAAEISAHPSDPYRLDVVVPGEQHFYLKAASPHQRQEWLMALGTVKSCLNSEKASQLLLEEDYRKRRLCELRLYCDLLVQQVHSIKSAVIDNPIPDIQKMDENTSLLGQTCDTFIQALEECLQMTAPLSPLGYKCPLSTGSSSGVVLDDRFPGNAAGITDDVEEVQQNGIVEHQTSKTFFGSMNASFAHIRLHDDASIPTVAFLQACSTITSIFDLLGSTAFAPVKMDINGNIRKLTQKYDSNPERFQTLHQIVYSEMEKKTTNLPNSATDALLWLKRGIHFLREFVYCFQMGETDLTECANKAYANSLKKYHGWVVRGVFSIASKAAPSREDFLKSLCGDFQDTDSPDFNKQLHSEITSYLAGIDRCLKSLDHLYESNGLAEENTEDT